MDPNYFNLLNNDPVNYTVTPGASNQNYQLPYTQPGNYLATGWGFNPLFQEPLQAVSREEYNSLKQELEALSLTQTVSREDHETLEQKVEALSAALNVSQEERDGLKYEIETLKEGLKIEVEERTLSCMTNKQNMRRLTEYVVALQTAFEHLVQKSDPDRSVLTPRWEDFCTTLNLRSSE